MVIVANAGGLSRNRKNRQIEPLRCNERLQSDNKISNTPHKRHWIVGKKRLANLIECGCCNWVANFDCESAYLAGLPNVFFTLFNFQY